MGKKGTCLSAGSKSKYKKRLDQLTFVEVKLSLEVVFCLYVTTTFTFLPFPSFPFFRETLRPARALKLNVTFVWRYSKSGLESSPFPTLTSVSSDAVFSLLSAGSWNTDIKESPWSVESAAQVSMVSPTSTIFKSREMMGASAAFTTTSGNGSFFFASGSFVLISLTTTIFVLSSTTMGALSLDSFRWIFASIPILEGEFSFRSNDNWLCSSIGSDHFSPSLTRSCSRSGSSDWG